MATVREMYERFAAFDPIGAAGRIMQETPEAVLNYNRKQLYEQGIDKNEVALPDYSQASIRSGYVDRKRNPRLNAGGGSYDMKNTSATFDGMTVDVSGEEFSLTPHTDYAFDRVTDDAYGLTEESKAEYWNTTLKSALVESLAAATGCTVS